MCADQIPGHPNGQSLLAIRLAYTNAAPIIQMPNELSVPNAGAIVQLARMAATDREGDAVSFSATLTSPTTNPASATLEILDGELTITPRADFEGDMVVDVTATDGDQSTHHSILIHVPQADAPNDTYIPPGEINDFLPPLPEDEEEAYLTQNFNLSAKNIKPMGRSFLNEFFFRGMTVEHIKDNKLTFGDQTIHLGFALTNFAIEAHLLKDSGRPTQYTETVITSLLEAFDVLEGWGEYKHFGTNAAGFFVRDAVSKSQDQTNAEQNHNMELWGIDWERHFVDGSDFDSEKITDAAMSLDQLVYMFQGWLAVHQWVPAEMTNVHAMMQRQVSDVMDYLMSHSWIIANPLGEPSSPAVSGDPSTWNVVVESPSGIRGPDVSMFSGLFFADCQ